MFEDERQETVVVVAPARAVTAVDELEHVVAALRAREHAGLPGEVALEETRRLLVALEQLQAVSLAWLADVHRRQLHDLADAPSAGAWVERQQVGLDRGVVALAKRLDRVPAVAGAVADGRLALRAAEQVAGALERVRRHLDRPDGQIDGQDAEAVVEAVVVDGVLAQLAAGRGGWADDDPELAALRHELHCVASLPVPQVARVERAFLLLAERISPPLLRPALDQLVDALLPQQLEDRAERAHQGRGLRLVRSADGSGWTVTRGDLDLETGELLQTVLAAARSTDPAGPGDTAAWAAQRADDAGAPAPRSRVQQDHDALKLALRRLLDVGALGLREKVAPHLTVIVGLDGLEGRPGALPAVTAQGTTLTGSLVRRLLCDSRISRVVLSLGRRALDSSHTERTLKPHERRALHVQWGGRCAGAGCTSPPGAPLVPHHADPWHRSGTTSYAESVPLCESTHHDLHEGGRTIRLRDGRSLSPSGWVGLP